MKQILFAAALCVGLASANSAFAERWVTPANGNVSAVMMSNGSVMMKIKIPAKEFQAVVSGMKENNNDIWTIKEIHPDDSDTMILVYSPNGS